MSVSPGRVPSASARSTSSPCSAPHSWCRFSRALIRPPPCSSRPCPRPCCSSTRTSCRYFGSSFGFIAPITAVSTADKGIAVASFGILCTGVLLALVGVLVHYAGAIWIDLIMPPVVNGAIVAIIGFNLAPTVWTNFQTAPDTAVVTLLAVVLVAVLFKGLLGRLNILIGVLIGLRVRVLPRTGRLHRDLRRRVDRLPQIPPAAG